MIQDFHDAAADIWAVIVADQSDRPPRFRFFTRIRRACTGIQRRFSKRYLDWFAADIAWREDTRRVSNGSLTWSLLAQALKRRRSRCLCRSWQGQQAA